MYILMINKAIKCSRESLGELKKASTPRVLSIMPKIPEISVGIQMERSVSVSSDRNIENTSGGG